MSSGGHNLSPRTPLRLLALGCLAAGVAAASCAPDLPQLTLTRRPIINGEVDTTHQSVVALVYTAYGAMEEFCTGTVIGKRRVLTAAHCYRETGFPANQTKIFIGQTAGSGGQTIQISDAHTHPDYYQANDGKPVNDICVVELAEDAPVPAMQWQQTALGNIVGQTVTLVGYGVTNAEAQTGEGTRRSLDQQVSAVNSMYIEYLGGGTAGTCQGDSGGPMLTHGGAETIIGVTSYGDVSCVIKGANTRVDIHADFIRQYVGTTQPVTVGFTQPATDSTQGSTITVAVTAQSTAGVAQVDLFLDGTARGTATAEPYTFTLTDVAAGAHTIRAVGTGSDGGTGEASVSVTVTTGPQCSAQRPCAMGSGCVGGQCIPYAPGTPGASCRLNTECQSSMCVDGSTDHGYCTEVCGSDQDCHNEAACLDIDGMALCGPPNSATVAGVGGFREILGGCRAAPGTPARPAATLLLLLLALVVAGRPRRL